MPGGGGTYKEIWEGDGEYHAVEIDDPDFEPPWNATSQGPSLCDSEVWVLRREWPSGTLAGERCRECERRSGM